MTVGLGAEFGPVEQLGGLPGGHPGSDELGAHFLHSVVSITSVIQSSWKQVEQSKERISNLVVRGNHKLAQRKPDQVAKLIKKNIEYGFSMVMPNEATSMADPQCNTSIIGTSNTVNT
jgi:hypothetical protein